MVFIEISLFKRTYEYNRSFEISLTYYIYGQLRSVNTIGSMLFYSLSMLILKSIFWNMLSSVINVIFLFDLKSNLRCMAKVNPVFVLYISFHCLQILVLHVGYIEFFWLGFILCRWFLCTRTSRSKCMIVGWIRM